MQEIANRYGTKPQQRDESLYNKRLTVHELARILGLSHWTLYKWARLGWIPCIRQGSGGRQVRFKLADIEQWEAEQTTGKL